MTPLPGPLAATPEYHTFREEPPLGGGPAVATCSCGWSRQADYIHSPAHLYAAHVAAAKNRAAEAAASDHREGPAECPASGVLGVHEYADDVERPSRCINCGAVEYVEPVDNRRAIPQEKYLAVLGLLTLASQNNKVQDDLRKALYATLEVEVDQFGHHDGCDEAIWGDVGIDELLWRLGLKV